MARRPRSGATDRSSDVASDSRGIRETPPALDAGGVFLLRRSGGAPLVGGAGWIQRRLSARSISRRQQPTPLPLGAGGSTSPTPSLRVCTGYRSTFLDPRLETTRSCQPGDPFCLAVGMAARRTRSPALDSGAAPCRQNMRSLTLPPPRSSPGTKKRPPGEPGGLLYCSTAKRLTA